MTKLTILETEQILKLDRVAQVVSACEQPWRARPPLLTRSNPGPAGGRASQGEHMHTALGG